MRESLQPSFEFTWRPALWSAAALVLFVSIAIFILGRPGWMLPAAILAGAVAAVRSSYYEPSGNNAIAGIAIGLLGLLPVFIGRRYLEFGAWQDSTTETWFLAGSQLVGDYALAVMLFPVLGYLGALGYDLLRRRLPVESLPLEVD